MLKFAVMASGGGTDFQSLIDAVKAGQIDAEICCLIASKPDIYAVERAKKAGIPVEIVQKKFFGSVEAFDRAILATLKRYLADFVVLAGYLNIVGPQTISAYENKIINIHHSFLPAFVGAKPYHAAFQRGVKIIGATSHYVTTELDAGPIIEQDVVRITHKDSIEDLVNKGKDLEKIVLSRAVQKHIERKILAYKNKTVIFS
mgnify:CR=1 FL=1